MTTAGVDVGSLTTKAVVVKDGKILSWSLAPTAENSSETAEKVMNEALKKGGASLKDIAYIVSTGIGKKEAISAKEGVAEVICNTRGAQFLYPSARTIIDIGAESSRVIRCGPGGKIIDYALNDKCAAGTGIFLDAMAKALQVPLEEMGALSLQSKKEVKVTSMCLVFAESEVVSQIHHKVNKVDILAGIHESTATRIYGMINRVGVDKDVVVIGGVARNIGVVKALEKLIGTKLSVPESPQIVGALGAALIAQERMAR